MTDILFVYFIKLNIIKINVIRFLFYFLIIRFLILNNLKTELDFIKVANNEKNIGKLI